MSVVMSRKVFVVYVPMAVGAAVNDAAAVERRLWCRALPSSRHDTAAGFCGPDFEVVQIGGDSPEPGLLTAWMPDDYVFGDTTGLRYLICDIDDDVDLNVRAAAVNYVLAVEIADNATCDQCGGFADTDLCSGCDTLT